MVMKIRTPMVTMATTGYNRDCGATGKAGCWRMHLKPQSQSQGIQVSGQAEPTLGTNDK